MVEHRLAKARVAGSSPVSRSNLRSLCSFPLAKQSWTSVQCRQTPHGRFVGRRLYEGRGTQVVRERSAKPLCVGSIPTRASNIRTAYLFVNQLFEGQFLVRSRSFSIVPNRPELASKADAEKRGHTYWMGLCCVLPDGLLIDGHKAFFKSAHSLLFVFGGRVNIPLHDAD